MAEKRTYNKKSNSQAPIQANEYGKLPPQALELEEAVLGAIMIEKDAYSLISEILKPECFYKTNHQKIFRAIMNLAVKQEPIDMHTVTEQLRKDDALDEIGGPYYITLLTAKVSSAAHLEYHARIIAQKFLARELIRITSSVSVMVASIAPLSLNNRAIRLRLDFSPSFLNLLALSMSSFAFLIETSER